MERKKEGSFWVTGCHDYLTRLKASLPHNRSKLPALFVIHGGEERYFCQELCCIDTHAINPSFVWWVTSLPIKKPANAAAATIPSVSSAVSTMLRCPTRPRLTPSNSRSMPVMMSETRRVVLLVLRVLSVREEMRWLERKKALAPLEWSKI